MGVTVWVVCLIVIGIGIVIGKHSPEALANRVQQNSQQFDRARLAAEMLDKVTHRAGRMYDLCSYVGTVAAQFRMEALVPLSTCERIRTGQNDVIARINGIARNGTDEDLRAMSRIVDQFMIESAPQLQTMEESYATVNRIMREAGKK